ncbi:MAG: AgmX/PglI C-terminal domain-containing protein [Gammaproteobacteria bacterium]
MSTLTLHANLPWTGSYDEDRRFRLILLQTLLICLTLGAITPYIRIPQPDPGLAAEPPPRRVRLLATQFTSAPRPAPVAAPAVTPSAQPQPQPQLQPQTRSAPERSPVTPAVTPRRKAASTGVLALSDALAELRSMTPKTGTAAGQDAVISQGHAETEKPSMLTADVTRGSQGIEGGVAHQSVLGTMGLPDREDSRQGSGSSAGPAPAKGRASAPASGIVRSKEEIQEILDRHKGAMYALYNRELHRDSSLQGKLLMSITIAPAGNVTRCVILSSELGAVALEQQLVALIERIDFGSKPGVPAVTTKLPIEFFPR